MTKHDEKTILQIAKSFRKGLLGSKSSGAMCFAMSAALEGYLAFCGYGCRLIKGEVGDWDHCWIELQTGTVIDPTADQFPDPDGRKMPEIYIGQKPEWYKIIYT